MGLDPLTLISVASAVSGVASTVSSVVGGIQQASATAKQAGAQATASRLSAIEQETVAKREEAQTALESLQREKQLRSTLAAQRARFAGAGVDPFSGSAVKIQEAETSDFLRQQRQAGLFSALTVGQLNRQADQFNLASRSQLSAGKSAAQGILFNTAGSLLSNAAIGLDEPKRTEDFGRTRTGTGLPARKPPRP